MENSYHAGRSGRKIELGYPQLIDAVRTLVRPEPEVRDVAHAVIVIAQMICESMRFTDISQHIAANYYEGAVPTHRNIWLENNWGTLSQAILRTTPNSPFIPPLHQTYVTTQAVARTLLGLLVHRYLAPGSSEPQRYVEMETTADQALIPDGRALIPIPSGRLLAEVFSVCILNIDKEDLGDPYGTITATDGSKSYYIYRREKGDYESIKPGDHATLTGPSRAISAADNFTIDFDLFDYDDLSPNDSISRGRFVCLRPHELVRQGPRPHHPRRVRLRSAELRLDEQCCRGLRGGHSDQRRQGRPCQCLWEHLPPEFLVWR